METHFQKKDFQKVDNFRCEISGNLKIYLTYLGISRKKCWNWKFARVFIKIIKFMNFRQLFGNIQWNFETKIVKIMRKCLTTLGWNFECWAVQKRVICVDLVKSFPTRIWSQKSGSTAENELCYFGQKCAFKKFQT